MRVPVDSRRDAAGGNYISPFVFDGAKALITSSVTLTNNVTKTITFNGVSFDTGGYWSVANPTRLTITSSDKYLVCAFVEIQSNGGVGLGERRTLIRRSDGALVINETVPAVSSYSYSLAKGGQLDATAGQYFELLVLQNCGSDLPLLQARLTIWKMT